MRAVVTGFGSQRAIPLCFVATLVAIAALAVSCGGSSGGSKGPPAGSPITAEPRTGPVRGLDAYRNRCRSMDLRGALAQIRAPRNATMEFGDSSTLTATIKLYRQLPSVTLWRKLPASRRVLVSCVVQARLRPAGGEFSVDTRSWVDRSFLTSDAAQWSWQLTPKQKGLHDVVIDFRPVVVTQERELGNRTFAENANVISHITKVRVTVPWYVAPSEWMHSVTGLLIDAKAMLVALAGVLGAVIAIVKLKWPARRKTTAGVG